VITGSTEEIELVKAALPIIQERIVTLSEIPAMLKFLFVKEFAVDAEEKPKLLESGAQEVLKVALDKTSSLVNWDHASIEEVLRKALIEELGLKPRIAFSALRIALTGSHISPPLFESMQLLGKERSLARISSAITS
jgi:glutamyl-tRNA synthetase